MIKVADLPSSTWYLNKDQTYPGRSIVAYNDHKEELFELGPQELTQFMKDVALAAKRLSDISNADKINYAIFGDEVSHLHVHLVPKHKNGRDWGSAFEHEPQEPEFCSDLKYQSLINSLKNYLGV